MGFMGQYLIRASSVFVAQPNVFTPQMLSSFYVMEKARVILYTLGLSQHCVKSNFASEMISFRKIRILVNDELPH